MTGIRVMVNTSQYVQLSLPRKERKELVCCLPAVQLRSDQNGEEDWIRDHQREPDADTDSSGRQRKPKARTRVDNEDIG